MGGDARIFNNLLTIERFNMEHVIHWHSYCLGDDIKNNNKTTQETKTNAYNSLYWLYIVKEMFKKKISKEEFVKRWNCTQNFDRVNILKKCGQERMAFRKQFSYRQKIVYPFLLLWCGFFCVFVCLFLFVHFKCNSKEDVT